MNKNILLPVVLAGAIAAVEVAPAEEKHHTAQNQPHTHNEPTVILQAEAAVAVINVAPVTTTHRVTSTMTTPVEWR